jgi:hypothetical protein
MATATRGRRGATSCRSLLLVQRPTRQKFCDKLGEITRISSAWHVESNSLILVLIAFAEYREERCRKGWAVQFVGEHAGRLNREVGGVYGSSFLESGG